MEDWQEIFNNEWEPDPEQFPGSYEIKDEIKSPLNVLWYNMNYEFLDNYPAKMSADFAKDMIKMYSKKGDLVWDPCCGSGVILREAARLRRNALGTDINPKAIDLCLKHQRDKEYPKMDSYAVKDARDCVLSAKADLILSSFPFGLSIAGDKNNYSREVADISNSQTFQIYFEKVDKAIQNYYNQLKPKGIMILDARDRTKEGKYFDLINYFRNMAMKVGFEMLCRYTYFLMPWSHYTFLNNPTDKVVPMISTMDAIVMYKPEIEPVT